MPSCARAKETETERERNLEAINEGSDLRTPESNATIEQGKKDGNRPKNEHGETEIVQGLPSRTFAYDVVKIQNRTHDHPRELKRRP